MLNIIEMYFEHNKLLIWEKYYFKIYILVLTDKYHGFITNVTSIIIPTFKPGHMSLLEATLNSHSSEKYC
jgi:hypothetical protein